jgi:hypothetical protein
MTTINMPAPVVALLRHQSLHAATMCGGALHRCGFLNACENGEVASRRVSAMGHQVVYQLS